MSSSASHPVEILLEPEVVDSLRLNLVPGIGPRIFKNLLQHFGSASNVLKAPLEDLRAVEGVGRKLCSSIHSAHQMDVRPELERCARHNIDLISFDSPDYPRRLTEIDDHPIVLYSRGKMTVQDEMAIAIVGSRHATSYGIRQAKRLAQGLAHAGFTIVSGLARGIDSAAHRGALEAGGRTISVLGSGLLNVYPSEHAELALDIADQGAVLSEAPTHAAPKSGAFPRRNRLISGLSLGVIVVEAADRSGALISASLAAEQGREVFAVPGPIDSRMSRGCHALIRDGAKLVESIDDVIEELGPLATPMQTHEKTICLPAEVQLNELEQQVINAIGLEPTPVDDVVIATGLPVHRVLATISVLELKKLVRKTSGCNVVRSTGN